MIIGRNALHLFLISVSDVLQQAFEAQQTERSDRRRVFDFTVADHPLDFRQCEIPRHKVLLLVLRVGIAVP